MTTPTDNEAYAVHAELFGGSADPERHLLGSESLEQVAQWIVVGAFLIEVGKGVAGNAAYDLIRALGRAFFRRKGRGKRAELELQIYETLKHVKKKPQVSNHDLKLRAADLLDHIEGNP